MSFHAANNCSLRCCDCEGVAKGGEWPLPELAGTPTRLPHFAICAFNGKLMSNNTTVDGTQMAGGFNAKVFVNCSSSKQLTKTF